MEQKYMLEKKDNLFIIKELAETEPGKFALLFEEKLGMDDVRSSISKGKRILIDLFRSHNLYPPSYFSSLLADGIINLCGDDSKTKLTIEFNDNDAILHKDTLPVDILVDEKELAEIDKLLEDEDEISDDFDD